MAGRRRLRPIRKRQLAFYRGLFLVILGSLSLFYFMQSPFWSLKTVMVEGHEFVSSKELVQLSGLPLELNIFKVDLKQGENNVLLHPLIKNVKLIRKLPRTVLIKVEERTPVAILPHAGGFCQIDEQQVILRNIPTISNVELLLITGLEVENTNPGDLIPSEHLGEALRLVQDLPPSLVERIAEINLSDPSTIYLYTMDGVQVNFGNADRVEEKIKLMAEIFDAVQIQESGLQYVDLSFAGPPVIKYGK